MDHETRGDLMNLYGNTHRAFITGAALALASTCALGQNIPAAYPTRAITIVVPFAAGGNTDVKTRLVARQLGSILGQPVVIDNKPGASGNIGMDLVNRAAPDGYTLGMGSFGPLAVNPWIYPKLNFNPKSFVPIILLEKSPLVLVTQVANPTSRSATSSQRPRPGPAS